jgi:hypothetical protein
MNFSTAIDLFKIKLCMWRKSWDRNVFVGMQMPAGGNPLTLPYFFRRGKDGTEPWFPTIEDMFATDWEIVTSNQKNAPEEAAKERPDYVPTPTVEEMAAFNKARILRAKKAKEAKAKKTPRVIDPEAPWGRKKDGTPAKRRGPFSAAENTAIAASEAPLI